MRKRKQTGRVEQSAIVIETRIRHNLASVIFVLLANKRTAFDFICTNKKKIVTSECVKKKDKLKF